MTDSIEQREREQFEAAMKADFPGFNFLRDTADHYWCDEAHWAHVGWKARAALSAPQAGVPEVAANLTGIGDKPLCPCRMRNVQIKDGRYVEIIDHGSAK